MGRDLAEAFPVARRTFAEADEHLGYALSRLCFEGPAETLELTEHGNGRTRLRVLMQFPDKETRDMVLETGMEAGMQDAFDLLEDVARSLR